MATGKPTLLVARTNPASSIGGISVTYYLNPEQISDQARIFPQFETINPLGLTITEFHELALCGPDHSRRQCYIH